MLSKISLALSILLTIAVIYLFVNRGTNAKQTAGDEIEVAPAFSGDSAPRSSVVAFVNGDTLNAKYKFITEKSAQLEDKMKIADERVKKEYMSRQKEWDELMAYAQSKPLPPDEERVVQQRLMTLQSEIEDIQKREAGSLAKKEEELQNELQKRVGDFLKSYAKQRGIDYVFNKQSGLEIILYGSNAYDITNEVVAALNEEYEKEKLVKK